MKKFQQSGPASHVTGSDPIDGVCRMDNVTSLEVLILPHKFGGDRRVILVDFDLDQIVERQVRICRPQMRRLICENKRSAANHNTMT